MLSTSGRHHSASVVTSVTEKVSNEFLLEEIRENRAEIRKANQTLAGKVGRPELGAWLGTALALIAVYQFLGG